MPRPPPPATALTITGIPDLLDHLSACSSSVTGPSLPGNIGTPAFFIAFFARALSPSSLITLGSGPMKRDVARLADFGEIGALGQESVSGMNGVGACNLGGADDGRDVEVAVGAARRADAHVFIGKADVERVLVRLGKTATVLMPSSRQAWMTRSAISPRLAIRIFLNMCRRAWQAFRGPQSPTSTSAGWRTAARRTGLPGRSRHRP